MSEMKPGIITELPGPKSKELLDLRQKYVARGPGCSTQVFAAEAKGALIKDIDGNVFIDFAGAIGVQNVGHNDPAVVEAVKAQTEKFIHTCFHVMMYEGYVRLAEKLAAITPGNFEKKAMLANSGAEAVENAIKIARKYTKKTGILSLQYAFHGRTLMAMTLTSKVKPYKFGMGPFAPDVYKLPNAYCYRCAFGGTYPACGMECVKAVEKFFSVEFPAENVAAILVEAVQGEGGFIVPPKEYLQGIQEICRKNGILLIVDEIQTGFARTGRLFASEHFGLEPDLITVSKSLGAGVPISGVVGRAEIMDAPAPGEIGGTYGGSPLGCAAALTVIDLIEKKDLPGRAQEVGARMVAKLKELQGKYEMIGDVRGLGAMVGFELVKDRQSKEPAKDETAKILAECYQNGLIGLKAGVFDNVVRFLVPLAVTDEQMDQGLDILEKAMAKVLG